MTSPIANRYKLVIVGDGFCGKTCLLSVFKNGGQFPKNEYVPTVFQTDVATLPTVNDQGEEEATELVLWDTAGQEGFEKLRPLAYKASDIILLAFAVNSPQSFNNVENVWVKEIKHFCPVVPYILVGTKSDLREDQETETELQRLGEDFVSSSTAIKMAKTIKADCYMECSAIQNIGVNEVFHAAAKAAHDHKFKKKSGRRPCSIL